MKYSATLDLKAKLITGFVAVLFAAITIYNSTLINFNKKDMTFNIVLLLATIFIVLVFVFCYAYRPIGYIVNGTSVTVKRPVSDIVIAFDTINDVFLPAPESMRWTIRTFGNGGLFGYFGWFSNCTYGAMTWYATRTENYLIIVTRDNKKIVLTPDDTGMITEIQTAKV